MADDSRTYIRVHDGMPDHPKIDGLSDRAFRLLIETWCWCSRHLTDGVVPKRYWQRRSTPAARRELVSAGLVIDKGDELFMHDYLQHQRSKAQVEEVSTARRASALKANHSRWHTGKKGRPDPTCQFCSGSESDPSTDSDIGSESDPSGRNASGLHIGIGRGRGTVPEEETWGGGVPDTTANDSAAAPNLDPNNPRCGRHAHLPIGDPGPNCRGCRDVRRFVEREHVDETGGRAAGDAARRAWRAAVDACDECDESGRLENPDGTPGERHHPHPEES
jgi:hypothetical protein